MASQLISKTVPNESVTTDELFVVGPLLDTNIIEYTDKIMSKRTVPSSTVLYFRCRFMIV